MALTSVIKYEGDNTTFVWKYPETDFNIGSQLIVSFDFLNDTFYNAAFTNIESEYIQPVTMHILDDKEINVNVYILNDEMVPKLCYG